MVACAFTPSRLVTDCPPQYCAATRERREVFGKKMIKDGGNTKTIKKIHVCADNFDVKTPIPSRVPQPQREREHTNSNFRTVKSEKTKPGFGMRTLENVEK